MNENNATTDLQIMREKQSAEFALSPVGQTIKQFEVMQRMGQMYSQSTIVPKMYNNNIGNCVIALDMANRMKCNPLMVMQNLYIVNGNPSFSSKFLIATINASGRFSPLRYEFRGKENTPSYGCRCVAYEVTDREHKDPLYGDWITLEMAEKEGWMNKPGSKWKSMPNQMLRYRAAAFWQRAYCPEISMGLITTEEEHDIQEAEYEVVNDAPIKKIGFSTYTQPDVPSKEEQQIDENREEQEQEQQQPEAVTADQLFS